MKPALSIAAALALIPGAALAQSSISPTKKFSWSENAGWMNWRDAGLGTLGVQDKGTFLSGWIWCENIGWVSVGDGTPASGVYYANTAGADFGVNISPTGILSGFAWSENTGWINFSGGAMATPPQAARLDSAAGRLRGFAWSANIGWINLNDASGYVGVICYANCDQSTGSPVLTANDFQCFVNKFAAGDPSANCDRSSGTPSLTANDFTCFINKYVAGCS